MLSSSIRVGKCNRLRGLGQVQCFSTGQNKNSEAEDQMTLLPEAQQAFELFQKAQMEKALPLWHRSLEVYTNTMGKESPVTCAVKHKLAQTYNRMGDIINTEPILYELIKDQPCDESVDRLVRFYLSIGYGKKAQDVIDEWNPVESWALAHSSMYSALGQIFMGSTYDSVIFSKLKQALAHAQDDDKVKSKVLQNTACATLALATEDNPSVPGEIEGLIHQALELIEIAGLDENLQANRIRMECMLADFESSDDEHTSVVERLTPLLQEREQQPSDNLYLFDVQVAMLLSRLADAFHRHGDAVTSEGLFATALDKFRTHAAAHSMSYQVEWIQSLRGYQSLLENWEKRQRDAENIQKQIATMENFVNDVQEQYGAKRRVLSMYSIDEV